MKKFHALITCAILIVVSCILSIDNSKVKTTTNGQAEKCESFKELASEINDVALWFKNTNSADNIVRNIETSSVGIENSGKYNGTIETEYYYNDNYTEEKRFSYKISDHSKTTINISKNSMLYSAKKDVSYSSSGTFKDLDFSWDYEIYQYKTKTYFRITRFDPITFSIRYSTLIDDKLKTEVINYKISTLPFPVNSWVELKDVTSCFLNNNSSFVSDCFKYVFSFLFSTIDTDTLYDAKDFILTNNRHFDKKLFKSYKYYLSTENLYTYPDVDSMLISLFKPTNPSFTYEKQRHISKNSIVDYKTELLYLSIKDVGTTKIKTSKIEPEKIGTFSQKDIVETSSYIEEN